MKTVIIGTAGHIDHGKSELVAALTGTHPDRLREERERGITIDIGFASLAQPDVVLSFVDVPGHERFIKNMLAGASGIDLVLLAVAADESVRPQTREHFHICRLLGLSRGVIALTKSDLAGPELAELAREEVREFVKGSFLESAPIVLVSARTREGIPELVDALTAAAMAVPERPAHDRARLPVDRSFTVKGFGTVVTGTLVAGTIEAGNELEVLPISRRVKVRGVEVHGESVPRARAGQRTALNLQGISHEEIVRGDLLAEPGAFEPTSMFDARVSVLTEAPAPLEDLDRVRLHAGTAEILARVRPLGAEELAPGASGYAQFRLERPAILVPGDAFIFRRYSPAATWGGGIVIDAFPAKHRRADGDAARELERMADAPLEDRAERFVMTASEGGITPGELARRLAQPWPRIATALAPALRGGALRAVGTGPDLLISRDGWTALRERARRVLTAHHAASPMSPGLPLEEMRGRLTAVVPAEGARAALAALAGEGALRIEKDIAALPEYRVSLEGEDARLAEALSRVFREAGLNPPDAATALAGLGAGARGEPLLAHLVRTGDLRRLRDGLIFHREALEDLRGRLREYRKRSETIDVAAFKDLAGVSRKNAIPLLEHLDEERVTLRRGNERVILLSGDEPCSD
jgi:selenocysteine-specific elongation factor